MATEEQRAAWNAKAVAYDVEITAENLRWCELAEDMFPSPTGVYEHRQLLTAGQRKCVDEEFIKQEKQ